MAVMKAKTEESGLMTRRTRLVQRNKRKVSATTVNCLLRFNCGHAVVMTVDSVEGETASETKQIFDAEEGNCPFCRTVALGGRAFAGKEPPFWREAGQA